jgi:hypothetical protein
MRQKKMFDLASEEQAMGKPVTHGGMKSDLARQLAEQESRMTVRRDRDYRLRIFLQLSGFPLLSQHVICYFLDSQNHPSRVAFSMIFTSRNCFICPRLRTAPLALYHV